MSTLQRLILAFALVVAIGAGQGLFMLHNVRALREEVTFVASKPIAGVDNARAAWSAYRDAQGTSGFLEMTRPQESQAALATFDAYVTLLERSPREARCDRPRVGRGREAQDRSRPAWRSGQEKRPRPARGRPRDQHSGAARAGAHGGVIRKGSTSWSDSP